MNEKIFNARSIDIVISEDDKDLKRSCLFFLENIEKEYDKYILDLEKYKEEYSPYTKKKEKNVFFIPEKISQNSPITIINAPWGSGKTYFIETFAKHFQNKEYQKTKFEKIIILNAWKYSNSKNIPSEIIDELFFILKDLCNFKKNDILYIVKTIFNCDQIEAFNYLKKTKESFKQLKKNDNDATDIKNIKSINKKIPKTIIFLDNIERIGINSWEIIKAIYKLSELENFLFILPMNINKFNNKRENNDEYPLEKYINISFFNLRQNYLGLLKKMGFNDEHSNILNNIFNYEINGEKLSIREVENRLKHNDILNLSKNEYNMIFTTCNNIWDNSKYVEDYLLSDCELFIDFLDKLYDVHKEILSLIQKNNFIEELYNEKNYMVHYCFVQNNYHYPNYPINAILDKMWKLKWNENWYNHTNNYINDLKRNIEKYNNSISELNENISKNFKDIEKNENNIKEYDLNIKKLENQIKKIVEKEVRDNESILTKKQAIEMDKKEIYRTKIIIQDLERNNDLFLKNIKENKSKINNWELNNLKIIEYNEDYKKNKNNWVKQNINNKIIWERALHLQEIKKDENLSYNSEIFPSLLIDEIKKYFKK